MSRNILSPRCAAAAILALPLFFALSICGCGHSARESSGIFISADSPLALYVNAGSHGGADKSAHFFFPQLEIYDESGSLLYQSHDVRENAELLRDLPDRIKSMKPQPGTTTLAEAIDKTPVFRARKDDILGRRTVSIVSIFLEDCHACSLQEDALDGVQHDLLDRGTNLLVVHLSKPK